MVVPNGPTLLGLVGAVALLGLAALILRIRPATGPALMLGLFAAASGGQAILLRSAALVGPGDVGWLMVLLAQAAALPQYLFLVHFAAIFPRPLSIVRSRLWLPLIALPALTMLALMFADLDAAVVLGAGPGQPVFGWGTILVVFLPFAAAQLLTLGRFASAYLRAASPVQASQLRWGLGALLPYLGYQSANLTLTAPFLAPSLGAVGASIFGAAMALGLGVVLAIAALLAWRSEGRERLMWPLIASAPAAFGAAIAPGEVFGLLRLLLVAGLGYAVAKYQLFDLDLRLHRLVRPAVAPVVAVAVAGFAVSLAGIAVSGLASGGGVLPQRPDLALAAGALGLAVGIPLGLRSVRWLEQQFPYIRATDEYLLRRKLEVYRAGLDRGLPAQQLAALARDLRLRPWERRAVESVASPRAPVAEGTVAGRYRVEKFLAPGMYGRVLLAYDERVGERVVLKEYAGFAGTAAAEAWAREAKTMGGLQHRHVLAVRDVVRAEGDLYLALEHAPDGSLEQRLKPGQALPVHEALDLAEQLLAALAAAHKAGIVHRDVKPSNILFRRGTLKLADFGVALDPVLDGALRAAQASPGTLAWMAPEQALGRPAGKAADVYAAGAVLYRLLAGEHHLRLDGLGEQAARRAIARKAPRLPLAGVPEPVNGVLARALAKDPAARYPDAGAMLRDLRAARRGSPERSSSPDRLGLARAYGTP